LTPNPAPSHAPECRRRRPSRRVAPRAAQRCDFASNMWGRGVLLDSGFGVGRTFLGCGPPPAACSHRRRRRGPSPALRARGAGGAARRGARGITRTSALRPGGRGRARPAAGGGGRGASGVGIGGGALWPCGPGREGARREARLQWQARSGAGGRAGAGPRAAGWSLKGQGRRGGGASKYMAAPAWWQGARGRGRRQDGARCQRGAGRRVRWRRQGAPAAARGAQRPSACAAAPLAPPEGGAPGSSAGHRAVGSFVGSPGGAGRGGGGRGARGRGWGQGRGSRAARRVESQLRARGPTTGRKEKGRGGRRKV
jgi:hypothetical protein